jgi:uncharacterized repeat protein (TIGR01451 family)
MNKFKKIIVTALVVLSTLTVIGLTKLVAVRAAGPLPVDLKTAGNFVILTETGITNAGHGSTIIGNVGSSPITAAAMSNVFCSEITGTIYGIDANAAYVGSGDTSCFAGNPGVPAVIPPDANKTLVDNAVIDMEAAYTNATGITPNETDRNSGNIGGETFLPGVYKWNSDVTIPTNMTLAGGADDVWIFQITGTLDISANKKIILSGGARAKNIFWAVAGTTTLKPGSTFEGSILAGPGDSTIALQSLATLHGRALGQKDVTLISNTIFIPASLHLRKTVINDNGGTALNTAWTLSAIGATSSPINLSGTTPVDSGSTFKADTYTLGENVGPSGYASSTYSCVKNNGTAVVSNTITLAAGDDATCTITNNDIALTPTPTPTPVSSGGGSSPIVQRILPIISITKIPNPLTLPSGPGLVTYTYTVLNPGTVAMRDIKVTDDKCSNVTFVSGDSNNNSWLDTNETWKFTCASKLTQTTKNIATVIGYDAGGMSTTDVTNATVVVGQSVINYTPVITSILATTTPVATSATTTTPIIPKLPNTGLNKINSSWYIIALISVLSSLSLLYAIGKKHSD